MSATNKPNKLAQLLMQDARLDNLKRSYANAMWAWAHIESDLFGVFIAATDGFHGNFRASQESYFSVVSAKNRLDMTHTAAKARWANSKTLEVWLPLESKCRKQLAKRGKIAHLTGRIIDPEKPTQKPVAIVGEHFWHPQRENTYQQAKNTGYSARQLDDLATEWEQLHFQLFNFYSPFWTAQLEAQTSTFPRPTGGLGLLSSNVAE